MSLGIGFGFANVFALPAALSVHRETGYSVYALHVGPFAVVLEFWA